VTIDPEMPLPPPHPWVRPPFIPLDPRARGLIQIFFVLTNPRARRIMWQTVSSTEALCWTASTYLFGMTKPELRQHGYQVSLLWPTIGFDSTTLPSLITPVEGDIA
jgi:hypothetical protein